MVFFSFIFVLISGVAATVTHVKTSVKTQKSFVTCVGNGYKVYILCFIALSLSLSLSLSLHRYYELRLLLSKLIYKEIICNLNPVNVLSVPILDYLYCYLCNFIDEYQPCGSFPFEEFKRWLVGMRHSFQHHLSSVEHVLFCKQVIKVKTSISNSRSMHLIWFHIQLNFELITKLLYYMFILSLFSYLTSSSLLTNYLINLSFIFKNQIN